MEKSKESVELRECWGILRYDPTKNVNIDGEKFARPIIIKADFPSQAAAWAFLQHNRQRLRPNNYYKAEKLGYIIDVKSKKKP